MLSLWLGHHWLVWCLWVMHMLWECDRWCQRRVRHYVLALGGRYLRLVRHSLIWRLMLWCRHHKGDWFGDSQCWVEMYRWRLPFLLNGWMHILLSLGHVGVHQGGRILLGWSNHNRCGISKGRGCSGLERKGKSVLCIEHWLESYRWEG